MGGINRYDDISVSAYNPMTTQEIMMVPMMRRSQHDEANKQLQTQISELDKVDPLDVHFAEAQKIKSDLRSQIDKQAEQLSTEGFNNNTTGSVFKTNREIQDQFSPTGRIGKIHAAKIAEAKAKEDFMKNADKQFGQNVLEQKWLEHRGKYLGYNDQKDIVNIGNIGSPKYVDLDTGIRDVLSTLGSTTTEKLLNSGLHFENTEYGPVMMNAQGSIVTETNDAQLNNALKALKTRFIDKTGEGRISRDFEGRTTNEDLDYINNRVLGAKVFKQNKDYKTNYDMITPPAGGDGKDSGDMYNDAIQDPASIQNLKKNVEDVDFSQIGTQKLAGTVNGSPLLMGTEGKSTFTNKLTSYKDILTPLQQKFYETASKKLIAAGRLSKNAKLDDPESAKLIGIYMTKHMKFPTVANDIIRPDVAIDNKLFSGNLASKDQNSRNATLEQDVRGDGKNPPLRNMIDADNGTKIQLESGDKIDYLGMDAPLNYANYRFTNNKEQSVMAHRAHILDKDGNFKRSVVISRSRNEMNEPKFKEMYDVNQTYKSAIENLGTWVKPTGKFSGNNNLKKLKIKVNEDNTMEIQPDGYSSSGPLTNAQFMIEINKHLKKQ